MSLAHGDVVVAPLHSTRSEIAGTAVASVAAASAFAFAVGSEVVNTATPAMSDGCMPFFVSSVRKLVYWVQTLARSGSVGWVAPSTATRSGSCDGTVPECDMIAV